MKSEIKEMFVHRRFPAVCFCVLLSFAAADSAVD